MFLNILTDSLDACKYLNESREIFTNILKENASHVELERKLKQSKESQWKMSRKSQ